MVGIHYQSLPCRVQVEKLLRINNPVAVGSVLPLIRRIMERLQAILNHVEPQTWLFCGASVTHGALHTHGHRDYPQIFNERLRYELGRTLDVVINTAISGNTSVQVLEGFERRIASFHPQVVSLMIGLNDTNPDRGVSREVYRDNLVRLADKVAEMDAVLLLQTCNTIMPGTRPGLEGNFDAYMETIRSVAADRDLPLIDQTACWRKESANQSMWMNDDLHPNHYGHRFMAHNMFKALGIFDPETSHVCRHYLPRRVS